MLLHLIAVGLIPASGAVVEPGRGAITAPAERTAMIRRSPASSPVSGLPVNAAPIPLPFDPSDHSAHAMDFSAVLAGAKIATIERITVSALGASLGLEVDTDPQFPLLIDAEAGQKIQFWPKIAAAFEFNAAFSAGTKMGVSALVTTTDTPPERFEGTSILTVQQQ